MLAGRGVSIAVVALGLALGCASESAECPDAYCGNAVGLLFSEPTTLFPPVIGDADAQTVSNLIFFPLADIGADLNTTDPSTFEPRIARSWEFEDSLTLVLNIDPDARWHDGQPVTAHDVSFTFSVYMDTLLAVPTRSYMASIESVTARDNHTAVFAFNRWHREQLYTATYHMRVLPRHILESVPSENLSAHDFATNPIGNGPYRFERWNRGQSIQLAADTTFFLGRPGLQTIEWQFARDPNTIMTPLIAGAADILSTIPGPENVALAERQDHLTVHKYPGNHYGYLAFNLVDDDDPNRPHPIFNDPDMRRAIALAIDRGLVARTAHGDSAIAPAQPATRVGRVYQVDVPVLGFDPTEARSVLQSEGWDDSDGDGILDRDGLDLEFELLLPTTSNPRLQSAAVIQSLLREIGIEVVQDGVEFPVYAERTSAGNFDAYIGTWTLQPSPAGYPNLWTSLGLGSQNYGRYVNPEVDSLMALATLENDPAREYELWGEAFAAMNRDPGAIWLYAPDNYAAIHARFDNVTLRPDRWSANMWQWRVREGEWLRRDVRGR